MDMRTLVDERHLTSELFSARLEHGSVLSSYHLGMALVALAAK
jgi:hypothetical protein